MPLAVPPLLASRAVSWFSSTHHHQTLLLVVDSLLALGSYAQFEFPLSRSSVLESDQESLLLVMVAGPFSASHTVS